MYILAILGCSIIVVAVFFILSLDKIIIKPLIKNYTIQDTRMILVNSKPVTTNISGIVSYGK